MSIPKNFNLDYKENFEQKNKVDTEKYKRYCFGRKMANNIDYSYDGKFKGNILIVEQSRCEKTTFVKNLAKNGMFGDIKKIYWVSKISLSLEREKNKSLFQKTC